MMLRELSKERLLLVEGKDEEKFFGALAAHLALTDTQVWPVGGKTKFRESIKVVTRTAGWAQVNALAVVRDADTDPAAAFESVCSALRAANLPEPAQAWQRTETTLRVTVAILPDGDTPGMLEDVCLRAVSDSPASVCVEELQACLARHLPADQLPHEPAKASVRGFLAAMEWAEEDLYARLQQAAEAIGHADAGWPTPRPAATLFYRHATSQT